jgi:hypothetical protein
MEANVGLDAFWKRLQYAVHVDALGVLPFVIERFLHLLGQRFADSMMFDEIADALLHLFQFFCALIQLDDNCGDTAKYGGT